MIASPNRSSRGGRAVRLIVIHTAEGALTTASLGNYFAKTSAQASSHVGVDDRGVEMYVPYDQMSWTVRSGNAISDNAELCGFAAWTRDQWLNQHMPMLRLTAGWIRERCLARGIPIRKLTPAQVGAGQAGVCGHIDWTLGAHDGSHTDPGPGFPWDVVISMAAGNPPTPTPPPAPKELFMALTAAEEREILEGARSVLFGEAGVRSAGRMAIAVSDLHVAVEGLTAKVDEIAAKPGGTVDPAPIVAAVVEAIADAGMAQQVIDALAERLANPAA